MQTAITNIIQVDNLKDGKGLVSVARVNRDTGELYVNRGMFNKLPVAYRKFILFHEAGHATLQTSDESLADEFALKAMLAQGESLTAILKSLTYVLDYKKPSHYARTLNVFEKLRNYDLTVNNNNNVLKPLKNNIMQTPQYMGISDTLQEGLMGPNYSDFLGLGKKAKERRAARQEAKLDKKDAKNQLRLSRAEVQLAKADSMRDGTYKSGASEIFGKVADTVGGFFGARKDTAAAGTDADYSAAGDDKQSKMVIIIVVVAVVVVVLGFVIWKSKKK